ncbi:GNAT family N-acetyltransferase [Pseudomonas sp. Fig-3]|uniref:GNAT family N-acetyltransferase n=1 Tax=unclassified Pseudomonas TaxID=196821 RepID=UPI0011126991|nr:GNAT family N-acetyltransferase [Pseudomonas sp. Fig-3]
MWASVYRSATPGDAANCFRVESLACAGDANATLEDFQDWIQRTPENFLIYEHEGKFVGFAHFGHSNDDFISEEGFKEQCNEDASAPYLHVRSIAVGPSFARHRFLSALIENLESIPEELNKKSVHLRCRDQYVDFFREQRYRYLQEMRSDEISTWHEMGINLMWN